MYEGEDKEFDSFTDEDYAAVEVEMEAERVLWRAVSKVATERANNVGLESG